MLLYRLLQQNGNWLYKLISLLALVLVGTLSLVLHEVAHGYVALWNGDPTAKVRGRLSLNPFRHFDMIGLLFLFFVGFGWAKPVPIDANNFRNRKKGIITVSIAGVCTNLVLMAFFLLLTYLFGVLIGKLPITYAAFLFPFYLLSYGVQINLMLALFNILPIYPLDGFVLLNTFLPRGNPYSTFMYRYGNFVLIGIILIGQISSLFGFKYLDLFGLINEQIANLVLTVLSKGAGI